MEDKWHMHVFSQRGSDMKRETDEGTIRDTAGASQHHFKSPMWSTVTNILAKYRRGKLFFYLNHCRKDLISYTFSEQKRKDLI